MDLGLADQVFVLTGASKGLGYATAAALVADGARVVVSSRDSSQVSAAVSRLGDLATGVVADLTDTSTPEMLVGTAIDRFGRFDGALISVGGPPSGTAASITDEQWLAAFQTVFLGSVRAARVFAEALAAREGGAIGLVLSRSSREPLAGLGLSNGLRPGLAGVAKDMSNEYGHRNVRFVSLLPGRILTDRNRELFEASGDPGKAAADAAGEVPLGRIGDPDEFGRVAAFCLSPAASYLTGITVPVDGGALRGL
ncbi:SDR family oxidoreductase [Actinoplanes sp. NBRC 103695]|uniref:SDR family oxidoreductase n=1 Tax=Actinoplanes sp. NBRC 103695 TaxID=3032202 RepID=UPI0024A29F7F|nr:SDR family oxidoreductase [Actinoplanes sp. NBRC 103695]GLY93630.1 oxidoreductase [Actinoplanes sp. NBRC 103695]